MSRQFCLSAFMLIIFCAIIMGEQSRSWDAPGGKRTGGQGRLAPADQRTAPRMGCSASRVLFAPHTIRQNCARNAKATGLYCPVHRVSTCYLNIYQQARVDIVDNSTVAVETFVDKSFAMSMTAAPLSVPLLFARCRSFISWAGREEDRAAGRSR